MKDKLTKGETTMKNARYEFLDRKNVFTIVVVNGNATPWIWEKA